MSRSVLLPPPEVSVLIFGCDDWLKLQTCLQRHPLGCGS
jgi:hypothetical protein